ncbi:replication-relaxation family protein [Actinoallomurus sp. CA-150999]|uniref:replication-relaxation family protein n=1 Tax=Actinoallomurus sp. CA-150999 TaxID=3239887 RepID=UPI003D92B70B
MPTDATRSRNRTTDLLGILATRLTERDRWLLRMLHEHKVFTTAHVADLAFAGNTDTSDHRLLILHRLDILQKIRPLRPGGGSAPCHWLLNTAGAEVIAAERGLSLKELGWRRDRATAVMLSAKLGHLLGVNGFFTRLAARSEQGRLSEWWPEARCAATWKKFVQPDGYGRWNTGDRSLDFFLEYDNGTETLARVIAKIDSYMRLTQATGISTPALFYFTSPRREANFRRGCPPVGLPVLTASARADLNEPADSIWARLGSDDRRPLADFAKPGRHRQEDAGSPAPGLEPSAWTTRQRER